MFSWYPTTTTVTPFRLREPDVTVAGQVRATGVWLAESGEAHTLQQIDLYT
ncbi:MAG: hypothetical protein JW940_19010 [Polyangiaceae bacterium]|nr:hypothetical protein [Polyangiaceae bacterium]